MLRTVFRGRNQVMNAQATRNGTHRYVRCCYKGSWHTMTLDDWCNKDFCPPIIVVLICGRSSRVPEDNDLVVGELHVNCWHTLRQGSPDSLPLLCTSQGAFLHCIPRRVAGKLRPAPAACAHRHHSGKIEHFSDTQHLQFISSMETDMENAECYCSTTRTKKWAHRHPSSLMYDTVLRMHPNNLPGCVLLQSTTHSC